ncbi:50S ribosomal protein L25/general stress protein Ctc [Sunxiuqinia elliptica]|uniref:Large ribosomal subunit protein bL25 n=1 Tax=Sunxiuqinia elliptica TaxID=655355 RepID=A0A1I2FX25_9BACT|nr:50S ribosomal protein L25/general stress protein Ctc [Sunxiuqinia elliptica]SFF09240.1 large subunit ribosomal protein L25 [Sunxiuqinia elliptica]
MKSIDIKGQIREGLGKKESKKLRNEGKVPCVLYGGEEPIHFFATTGDFRPLIYSPDVYLINLEINGEVHSAIMQDVQFHPVEEQILHVDFLKTTEEKPVKIEVPIKVTGYAKGMRSGGKLKVNLRRLRVKALAKDLPDVINVDITKLGLGDSVKVGELELENIEFLNSKSVPVVSIIITRAARAAMGTAAAGNDDEEEATEE